MFLTMLSAFLDGFFVSASASVYGLSMRYPPKKTTHPFSTFHRPPFYSSSSLGHDVPYFFSFYFFRVFITSLARRRRCFFHTRHCCPPAGGRSTKLSIFFSCLFHIHVAFPTLLETIERETERKREGKKRFYIFIIDGRVFFFSSFSWLYYFHPWPAIALTGWLSSSLVRWDRMRWNRKIAADSYSLPVFSE